MRVMIVAVSAILALASSVHAAPRPYSFELNERRDRDASSHNKEDDKLASIAAVTVFTTSPEVGPLQDNIESCFILTILMIIGKYKGTETSTTSTASTVTVFVTDPSATNSAPLPANTVGTISDLIASLDLLFSLKNSDITLPSNSIVGNVGKTNIQDPDSVVIDANGASATGGNGGIGVNGGDAFSGSSGFATGFTHVVNGNEISGGDFNGTTVDASNPAS
ncbi:hypothetical protein ACEPAI_3704 [Sanghuangporus weigelae]